METTSQLTSAQSRAVLAELRSKFPGREEFRYAAVVLNLEQPGRENINLVMTVACAAIDTKAIAVAPSAIVAVDEQVICLVWLVNPTCPNAMLELLQKHIAANVQAALKFGMSALAEREKRKARQTNAH